MCMLTFHTDQSCSSHRSYDINGVNSDGILWEIVVCFVIMGFLLGLQYVVLFLSRTRFHTTHGRC